MKMNKKGLPWTKTAKSQAASDPNMVDRAQALFKES